jgi:hypothetical protein
MYPCVTKAFRVARMGLSRDITSRQLAGLSDGRRLRTREAAKYLGVGESTLEKWRITGSGPQFERVGMRIVVYSVRALEVFLAARRANSTSERPVERASAQPPAKKGRRRTRSGTAVARR